MFRIMAILGPVTCLMFAFQNCSGVKYSAAADGSLSKSEGGSEDDASGVVLSNGGEGRGNASGESLQPGCLKFESLAVGQAFSINGSRIRISELTYKSDSPGEVIGFKLDSASNQITFLVKAGGAGYEGIGKSWVHPNGISGPSANAISHVTYCVGVASEDIIDPSLR